MLLNHLNKLALLIRNGNSKLNQKSKIVTLWKIKLSGNKGTIRTSNKITDPTKTKTVSGILRERIEIK